MVQVARGRMCWNKGEERHQKGRKPDNPIKKTPSSSSSPPSPSPPAPQHEEAFAQELKLNQTEPVLLYSQCKRKSIEDPEQALPTPPQKRKPDAPWRPTSTTSVSIELFDAYYAMIAKKDNFDAPLFDQLKSFVHFTAMTHAQQEEKQMTFFETPLGEVGADEMQVLL